MQEDATLGAAAAFDPPAGGEPYASIEPAAVSQVADIAAGAAAESVAPEGSATDAPARFPDVTSWLPGDGIWLYSVPVIILLLLWLLYPVAFILIICVILWLWWLI